MGGQRVIYQKYVANNLPISGESKNAENPGETTVPNNHTWFNIFPQIVVALMIIRRVAIKFLRQYLDADQERFDSYGVVDIVLSPQTENWQHVDFHTNHHRSNGELLRIRLVWTVLVLHVCLMGNPGLKRGAKRELRSLGFRYDCFNLNPSA